MCLVLISNHHVSLNKAVFRYIWVLSLCYYSVVFHFSGHPPAQLHASMFPSNRPAPKKGQQHQPKTCVYDWDQAALSPESNLTQGDNSKGICKTILLADVFTNGLHLFHPRLSQLSQSILGSFFRAVRQGPPQEATFLWVVPEIFRSTVSSRLSARRLTTWLTVILHGCGQEDCVCRFFPLSD